MSTLFSRLRKYLVVNSEHVDPHSVYIAGSYRKATVGEYSPLSTPFDKVANNYYFKRDNRRQFPKTYVYSQANDVKLLPNQHAVKADANPSAAFPPTPGKPRSFTFSEAPSEYPSINFWK